MYPICLNEDKNLSLNIRCFALFMYSQSLCNWCNLLFYRRNEKTTNGNYSAENEKLMLVFPHSGMFAIKTDHAAVLHRHIEGSMTWSKYAVNLAWLGFADIHSDVTHYFINIGSKYMSADLNAVRLIIQ